MIALVEDVLGLTLQDNEGSCAATPPLSLAVLPRAFRIVPPHVDFVGNAN
jgi:hypothetical protein